MKRVNLHIDHVVLRGFRHEDRHAIAEGIRQELQRMLADPQAARQLVAGGDVSRLKIGKVNIAQGVEPQGVGAQVAQGIGKKIRK